MPIPPGSPDLEKATTPLRWFVGGIATALVAGGLIYVSVWRIDAVEAAVQGHQAEIKTLQQRDAEKETRLQLVERAVLSLEQIAQKR